MDDINKIKSYQFFKQLTSLPFINQILLYGSRANNTHQSRSDIDLAIDCPDATEKNWLTILDIIDGADTLLKIDCIRWDTLKDNALKNSISSNHQILFKRG